MNYSTNNYSISLDYHPYSVQYRPQSSLIYPFEQMVNVNQSLTRVSEDIIDEESKETHSSDSDPLIIRYDSPSLSPYSRQVIIKSTNQTVTISNKPRRHRFQKKYSYEKTQSSQYKHHHSSSKQSEYREDRLKRLFDEYSSEDINRGWKPLTFIESRELYQYAFDKHHKKSRFN